MQTQKSFLNYKSHLKLIKSNSRRLLFGLSPSLIPRTSIDVRLFYSDPFSQMEYSICRPLINFIRLGQISHVRTELKTPYRQRFKNITIRLLRLKIRKPVISRGNLFSNHARGLISERIQIRLSAELIAQSSVRPNSSSRCFAYKRNPQEHFYSGK